VRERERNKDKRGQYKEESKGIKIDGWLLISVDSCGLSKRTFLIQVLSSKLFSFCLLVPELAPTPFTPFFSHILSPALLTYTYFVLGVRLSLKLLYNKKEKKSLERTKIQWGWGTWAFLGPQTSNLYVVPLQTLGLKPKAPLRKSRVYRMNEWVKERL